jgi:hypothetical protein
MNCNYDTLKEHFDYEHYGSNDYCVEYYVYYNAPAWSISKWYNVVGLTSDNSLVDLLRIGYSYQFPWLVEGTYTK